MAPSARVKSAFRAMKDIGISEDKTKPALKKLLKVFDKNWDLIEAENYRVLADAIFEYEESEAAEKEKKKAANTERGETSGAAVQQEEHMPDEPMQDEPERPLKRLRLKHQGQAASSDGQPSTTSGACLLKIPKPEPGEPDASPGQRCQPVIGSTQVGNKRAESLPVSPQPLARNKGKQPVSSHNLGAGTGRLQPSTDSPAKEKIAASERQSRALQIKEPKIEPGTMPPLKQKQPKMIALIKPKDEPFTDDMVSIEPLAVVLPDCTNNVTHLHPAPQAGSRENQSPGPARCEDAIEKGMGTLQSSTTKEKHLQEVAVCGKAPSGVDIASSTRGEVKISLSCDSGPEGKEIHLPSMEAVLKKVNDRCLRTYNIKDPEFCVAKVMKEFCECVVELGTTPVGASPEGSKGQDGNAVDKNGSCGVANGSLTEEFSEDVMFAYRTLVNNSPPPLASSCTLVDTELNKNATEEDYTERNGVVDERLKSIVVAHPSEMSDITKGKEAVVVSLEKSNCEFLPSFRYISKNVISSNADVKFSLAQIGDDDCCTYCHGNCLDSSPCRCSERNGGESPYTLDGLVREEFLDTCISIVRDPQSHCLVYCEECPLERLKNEDMPDPCKGHLKRNFIRECCIRCGCGQYCGNRVVQRGIRCSLQVFWTPEGKGWGLRTLVDLPKGAFVCEYVGEILTCLELHNRNLNRSSEKHSYSVLLDTAWGTRASKKEEFLCLDATFYGNVARFINHRCSDANLIDIPVEVETPSHHYYHVALFTTRKVNAYEELTWDYGVDFDDTEQHIKPFHCHCGSRFCRNMKRSSRSRSALTLQ